MSSSRLPKIVLIPQTFLTKYATYFDESFINNLITAFNQRRTALAEDHENMMLGRIEEASYEAGVGIVLRYMLDIGKATTDLKTLLNDFYAGKIANIGVSMAARFDTNVTDGNVTNVVELINKHPQVKIRGAHPYEVSFLSSKYQPAIPGARLRHDTSGGGMHLMLDFNVNKNDLNEKKRTMTDSKPDEAKKPEITDEELDKEYVAMQNSFFNDGMQFQKLRDNLFRGLKEHQIDPDDDEKKHFDEIDKATTRPSDEAMKTAYFYNNMFGKLDKKNEKTKNASNVDGKKEEGKKEEGKNDDGKKEEGKKEEAKKDESREKSMPPRGDATSKKDDPKKNIEKADKNHRQRILQLYKRK